MTSKRATPSTPSAESDPGKKNRGVPAQRGSGEVVGSGAGAGSGGNPEDYDSDPQAGGGRLPTRAPKPG